MSRRIMRPIWKTAFWFLFSVLSVSAGIFFFNTGGSGLWKGGLLILIGIAGGLYHLRSLPMRQAPTGTFANGHLRDYGYQEKSLRIVTIGGGTGLSTILRGLKKFTPNLTAIVTVADDGGSSGRLRKEFGILPPGDIRSCLIAMANLEPLMERLMQYRFNSGTYLSGHNFGNLFLTAMTGITGDFQKAIEASSQVLAVRGRVFPATLESVTLKAELADGSIINGETAIGASGSPIQRVLLDPPSAGAVPEAVQAIYDADVVILGPGSLYTSIIPPLLVREIAEAVKRTKAVRMYICNVMTQPGETMGFSAGDHIQALTDHIGGNLLDYVILNNREVPKEIQSVYAEEGAAPVRLDMERIIRLGPVPVSADLLQTNYLARHNAEKLAELIFRLIHSGKREKKLFKISGRVWRKIIRMIRGGFFLSVLLFGTVGILKEESCEGERLPYATVGIFGRAKAGYRIYNNEADRRELAKILPDGFYPENRVLIAISLGEKPTAGYGIEVAEVVLQDTTLIIKYYQKKPAPDGFVAQVLTYPGVMLAIEDSLLPAEFQVELKEI